MKFEDSEMLPDAHIVEPFKHIELEQQTQPSRTFPQVH